MERLILPLKRPFDFSRRASRPEFWLFLLFLFVVLAVLGAIELRLGLGSYAREVVRSPWGYSVAIQRHAGPLTGLFMLLMLIPLIAVTVRRLHDGDHAGWWLLILFVPVAGAIVVLIFCALAGTPGPNRFGDAPAAGSER